MHPLYQSSVIAGESKADAAVWMFNVQCDYWLLQAEGIKDNTVINMNIVLLLYGSFINQLEKTIPNIQQYMNPECESGETAEL